MSCLWVLQGLPPQVPEFFRLFINLHTALKQKEAINGGESLGIDERGTDQNNLDTGLKQTEVVKGREKEEMIKDDLNRSVWFDK